LKERLIEHRVECCSAGSIDRPGLELRRGLAWQVPLVTPVHIIIIIIIIIINYCQINYNGPLQFDPLTSTWPHLRCDVGLEEGEYK